MEKILIHEIMDVGGRKGKISFDILKEMDSNHQRTLIFVETKKLADVVAGGATGLRSRAR